MLRTHRRLDKHRVNESQRCASLSQRDDCSWEIKWESWKDQDFLDSSLFIHLYQSNIEHSLNRVSHEEAAQIAAQSRSSIIYWLIRSLSWKRCSFHFSWWQRCCCFEIELRNSIHFALYDELASTDWLCLLIEVSCRCWLSSHQDLEHTVEVQKNQITVSLSREVKVSHSASHKK